MQKHTKQGYISKIKSDNFLTKKNNTGSISIPCLIFFLMFCYAGFELFKIAKSWRNLVTSQLIIDQCVAHYVKEIQENLNAIEQLNKKIIWNRHALLVSSLAPQIKVALKVSLNSLVVLQNIKIATHKKIQIQWILQSECKKQSSPIASLPIKNLPWIRPPNDLIGQRPLKWAKEPNFQFHIQNYLNKRHSAATIKRGGNVSNEIWSAHWEEPFANHFNIRTSIH